LLLGLRCALALPGQVLLRRCRDVVYCSARMVDEGAGQLVC
jgi:hypothetical protein